MDFINFRISVYTIQMSINNEQITFAYFITNIVYDLQLILMLFIFFIFENH